MSTYSLDSLDRESSVRGRFINTRTEVDCISQIGRDNFEDWKDKQEVHTEHSDKDNVTNESSFVAIPRSSRERETVKLYGNSIIASKEFYSRVEKVSVTHGTRKHVRTGRPVEKKFNVPKRSLSRSSSSSSTEFRHGTASLLLTRKRPDDVTEFMKADKKPGNVKPDILVVDKRKKPVSYMQLYRTRFGVDRRQHMGIPVGSALSIFDDKSDERPAQEIDNGVDFLAVTRDENSDVGFHRPKLQLDSFATNATESCDGTTADYSRGFIPDDVQLKNRIRRVFYEPYDIEDYKSLTIPRADRSLGPDRKEMESKGEWLMRRRTYGDSVSALNRQRILHRAEKLKHSRRVDSQKVPLHPNSTDLKYPGPVSKINGTLELTEANVICARNSVRSKVQTDIQQRDKATRITEKSSHFSKKEQTSLLSKRKRKTVNPKKVDNNFYETSSNTFDDDSMNLKNLRNRHIEEKKTIDRLLKQGLSVR